MADQPAKFELPGPVKLVLKSGSYQSSKAGMEEESDMPGLSLDEFRATFFRPFVIRCDHADGCLRKVCTHATPTGSPEP
ncbi:MAG: hypothetical protein F4Z55_02165 [Boseongicola sp. SB0667_bin_21]|nr:hypothetical protein [Boseongicola sp. SB0667_bin_21]